MILHLLILAFFLGIFAACVIENDEIPKEEKYGWFAVLVGIITYTYLIALKG